MGEINPKDIKINDPELVKYTGSGADTNLDDVLKVTAKKVELSRKNINWLALYGGGGSGGSGGSGGPIDGELKVNGSPTGTRLVVTDTDTISFTVEQKITRTWDFTVKFSGKVIKVGQVSRTPAVIAGLANPIQ